MENYNFDNIRSYTNKELNTVLKKLVADKEFISVLQRIYDQNKINAIISSVDNIKSIDQFQKSYISAYANKIINETVDSLTFSGIENINPDKAYLFISNHRDIILDSALLNEILNRNKIGTTEIAIGSNLLIYQWIQDLVRLNRSFIVRRDLAGKDMLDGSKKLSAYIRNKIVNENRSVWIAQKEGRTKDGNDRTQVGLLKMFNFSGEKTFAENFKELNIIPVSISYRYEPCDAAKTQEIYLKNTNEKFIKTPEQDMISMARGLADKKGNIHFNFGKINNDELFELCKIPKINDRFTNFAKLIDREIHKGFAFHPENYIAYDLVYPEQNKFTEKYTAQEKQNFLKYTENKISELNGDKSALQEIFYKIYSNPLKNILEYPKE